MKRLAASLLALLILFSFASCSQADNRSEIEESFSVNNTITTEHDNFESNKETPSDKSQGQAIFDTVSTLIDHDILYNEELPRRYNFISETTGYFFQFKFFGTENRLVYLLKTEDGGKTWVSQDIQLPSSMGWRERIVCAEMLNENVGFIFGNYWADENFSDHTYVTADGGKTWTKVVLPENSPYVNIERSSNLATYLEGEAYDLTREDEVYILHVRAINYDPGSDSRYYYLSYSSTDLVNWTYIAP